MRISGGQARGQRLKAPKGRSVRPTPDRVKQALFNSLRDRLLGAAVLELFAGTGALSLESLSRGARRAVAVEKSSRVARFIRQNAAAAGFQLGQLQTREQDVFAAIRQMRDAGERFDLIIADPPYGEKNIGRRSASLAQQLLDEAALPQLLKPAGLFVLGHARRDTLTVPPIWREQKTLAHGDSVMRILSPAKAAE